MNEARPKIGIQLYTLRSLELDFASLVALAKRVGADGVQTVGRHGLSAPEMRDALATHDLVAIGSHVQLATLESDLDGELAFAREVGIDTLVVPFLPPHERPVDAAGWTAMGTRLGAMGARCREAGIGLAYHNHDFELVTVEGRMGLDWLFDAADSDDLQAELDLAWLARAGKDPLAALRSWGPRCSLIHAKDLAPEGEASDEDGWAQVGAGTLPWSALLPEALAQGVDGWIVEHDRPIDPEATVRGGVAFLSAFLDEASAAR